MYPKITQAEIIEKLKSLPAGEAFRVSNTQDAPGWDFENIPTFVIEDDDSASGIFAIAEAQKAIEAAQGSFYANAIYIREGHDVRSAVTFWRAVPIIS